MSLDGNLQLAFQQVATAVKARIPASEKGAANGVATLNAEGKVPATQLPSYVDDVEEYADLAGLPATGEVGKIYVALDTNITYRWSGSVYVKITSGEVSSVAGRSGVVTLVKGDVGLGNVDNTTDASKYVASASQLTTARTINGVSFNGTANITVPALDASKQPLDADLTAIAGLAGATGILKKTALDTWTLDTSAYVTSSGVTNVTGTAPIASSGGTTPAISITAASTTAAGSMSAADKTKLDGISSSANNYVLPVATVAALGGIRLNDATAQTVAANAVTTAASRTYSVQLGTDNKAVVNIPWVDTNTVYTHPTGDGNLHVPVTSTTNNGKVLKAGATAGAISWGTLAKGDVGLGNVDNTADAAKPISTATQAAITTLSNNVGATDTNYVTVFNTAMA
jgi:hypothetical protein